MLPADFTVYTPPAYPALPGAPTEPTSTSYQVGGKLGFGACTTVSASVVVRVKVPEIPVIVKVALPVVAVALALSVIVLVFVAGLGLKDTVTPLGRLDADKLTLPMKPLCGEIVIRLVPFVPCIMLRLPGVANRAKSPAVFTIRDKVVVSVRLPDVPVMVTVAGPVAAVVLAVSVRRLVLVAGFTLNAAVTPLGRPETDNVALPLKPFCGMTVIVLLPLVP